MLLEAIAAITAKEVVSHIVKWLVNLKRAGGERQQQSQHAVNRVASLVKKTLAYSRGLKLGKQDFVAEADLSGNWSDLSFELADLKLHALAKKCDVMSRYWSNPEQFPPGFLAEADISFETFSSVVRDLTIQIKLRRFPK